MTLTLHGRWQTRILLMTLFGLPVTALYTYLTSQTVLPFILLGYALTFGLGWDLLYNYAQSLRWNRDWPPLFAFYSGLWEGSILFLLAQLPMPLQPGDHISILPGIHMGIPFSQFWFHYGLVFGGTFLASLGLLHTLMPRWRYGGGEWM
ncbi:MAG: hypothetical protein AAF702_11060 [Chloroflexota bacterium]